jgi:3-dehydroquinate synthase
MQEIPFKKIRVATQTPYNVIVGKSILGKLENYIKDENRFVVTDSNVYKFYKDKIAVISKKEHTFIFQAGETSKNYKTLHSIYDFLIKNRADRYSYIIAIGGGVTGDIAAFSASTYMRGIPVVHIPTSLLAMVDSSIGGKTAINYGRLKNIIGSFYQPELVLSDISFLETLPEKEYLSAMAEVIKYGIIQDKDFFEFIENNKQKIKTRNTLILQEIVAQSAENKVKIINNDEKEKGQRALLNLGHTLAHAIESSTNYSRYLHGEAVSIGIVYAAVLSAKKSLIEKNDVTRIKNLLDFFNLPTTIDKDLDNNMLYKIMEQDKKNKKGKLRFVLTKSIGSSIIASDLNKSEVLDLISELKG